MIRGTDQNSAAEESQDCVLNSTQMELQILVLNGSGIPRSLSPRVRLAGLESSELAVKGLVFCRGAGSWGPSLRESGVSGSGAQTPYLREVPAGLGLQGGYREPVMGPNGGTAEAGPGRGTLTCRRRR